MPGRLKLLILSSVLYLVSASAGTILAIRDRLPAQFGGFLGGNDVVLDFLTWKGTALSAPLVMLLAQIVFTALAVRAGRAGEIGIGGLTVLGAMYLLGQLGEPVVGETFRGETSGWVMPVVVANLLFPLLMLVLGAGAWRTRHRWSHPPRTARST